MFTGIVEEVGLIKSLVGGQSSVVLTVSAAEVLDGMRIGDSIAINGACHTVTGFSTGSLTVDVMLETLRKTTLERLQAGARVNLERPLAVGGRLGGHLVTGHVDATVPILDLRERGIATEMWVAIPGDMELYVIPQGSVALDGVSLTIASLKKGALMVGLIPHTRATTTLGGKKAGDLLNIETDLLGKYVCRMLQRGVFQEKPGITEDLLLENGFI